MCLRAYVALHIFVFTFCYMTNGNCVQKGNVGGKLLIYVRFILFKKIKNKKSCSNTYCFFFGYLKHIIIDKATNFNLIELPKWFIMLKLL